MREVYWDPTQPTLLLRVELLGPLDRATETIAMSQAIYPIAVAEGITIICMPVEAGRDTE